MDRMDRECVEICEAINRNRGVKTVESCCGHGNEPFCIWIKITDECSYFDHETDSHTNEFARLLWTLDKCHNGVCSWACYAYTDCAGDTVSWRIESESKGEKAYEEATAISKLMRETMDRAGLDT